MSLTSFYNENPDVRARFRQEFRKPKLLEQRALLAPPVTTRYATVGIAFDYLLRFLLQRLNQNAKDKRHWIAEQAVDRLTDSDTLYEKGLEIVGGARAELGKYKKTGKITEDLIESALLLATLDPIFRAGVGHESIGKIERGDIEDLKKLLSIVDTKLFIAKALCLLNPTFGKASILVGGADTDLVIDDTLIDIKTTKKLALDRTAFDQIIGYYVLHTIAGVGGLEPRVPIENLAIYFSRYGYLYSVPVRQIINPNTFTDFVRWFEKRAEQEFGA